MTRVKLHAVPDRGGGRRSVVDMLETGVSGDMSGDHRRSILGRCLVCFFGGRCGLVFVIIVVAFAIEVLGAFMLMGGTTLQRVN